MKKLIFFPVLFATSFVFAQVNVTIKKDFNTIYNGGNKQFAEDVKANFENISSEYQVNGKFLLTFDLDENGKISHTKVSPEINNQFSRELIRTFKRMKSNFSVESAKNNLAFILDFSTDYKDKGGRSRFSAPQPRAR